MKQKLKIGVLLLSLFLLSGCNTTPEDVEDLLPPTIEIVGDDLIIIEQNTVFTYPGVNLSEDYDLEVSIDTDLNLAVLGDYTVTYSVTYEGVTYSGTRTVRVVAPSSTVDFEWELNTLFSTTDTISIFVSFIDTDGLLVDGKGSLYQEDTLVLSYDLISGDNLLNFGGLQSNTEYTFIVEGSYDDNGTIVILEGYELEIITTGVTTMEFSLSNEDVTHNSYSTDITIDYASNNINTKTVYLYLGDDLVEEMVMTSPTTSFSVDGLLADTEYVLKAVYTATPSDGGTEETFTEVLKTFSTATAVQLAPTFELFLCEVGFTSAECGVGVDTIGFTVQSLRVELWKAGSYDSLYQVEDNAIDIYNLDPGTEYNLKLYIDYKVDGSDELIAYTLLHVETITTKARTTVVENMVITTVLGTPNTTTFEFDLLDPDNTIDGVTSLTIYSNDYSRAIEDVVVGHNTIVITGSSAYENVIYPNVLYTVKITTRYQEDEGTMQSNTVLYEDTFLTQPDINVVSFTSNQSEYYFGDRFIMILELDNNKDAESDDQNIEYVTINGVKIYKDDFLFPSNNGHIYINMGVETDYTDYAFHITDFGVTMSDDSTYVFEYDETLSFRLREPGSIDPEEAFVGILEITTDDYTIHLQDFVTDYAQITIRLENKYDLDIVSINVSGVVYLASQFHEDSTSKQIVLNIELEDYYASNSVWARDLIYMKNGVAVDSIYDTPTSIEIYGYETEDVISISSAVELNSIDTSVSGKIYILSQDIDMQTILDFDGIGTVANPLSGVFDGNGHTIYNVNYTSYSSDQATRDYIGLFGYSNAFLYDITLTNMDFYVLTNNTHELNVGVLAGHSGGTIIDCNTWGTNVIEIDGMTEGYVGGLVGSSGRYIRDSIANTTIIIDGLNNERIDWQEVIVGGLTATHGYPLDTSSSSGTITVTNASNVTYIVGGLVGRFFGNGSDTAPSTKIRNSYSTVDISTTNRGDGFAGGLVGLAQYNAGILNCYASGDVYSQRGDIGGLVGGEYVDVINSFYVGNLSFDSGYFDLLTQPRNVYYLENNYTYEGSTITSDNGLVTPTADIFGVVMTASEDDYNDAYDFYTRVLGWSEYFFNFDGLDIVNGVLPTHK